MNPEVEEFRFAVERKLLSWKLRPHEISDLRVLIRNAERRDQVFELDWYMLSVIGVPFLWRSGPVYPVTRNKKHRALPQASLF